MSKKCLALLCLALLLGFVGNASADLVAQWKLDDGSSAVAVDASGNGNDGMLEDNPVVVNGQDGLALRFDNSRVTIPVSDTLTADLFTGSFTLSLWINPTRTGNTWQQVFRGVGSTGSDDTLFLNSDGRLSWRGRVNGAWAGGMCETAPDVVPADQWTHVAVVGDGTNFRIYVDASLIQESAFQITDGVNDNYYIGGNPNGAGEAYTGMVDDLRIYNEALTEAEIKILAARPKAEQPNPADGAKLEQTWVALGWRAGDFAVSHDVYMSDNFDDVNDRAAAAFQGNYPTAFLTAGFFGFPFPDGLVPGTTYYWRVDEINPDDPSSPWKGPIWSFWIPPVEAYNPNPSDGMQYVATDTTLEWGAGLDAKIHYVHFGDNFDDVNNSTAGTPATNPTFTPGTLEKNKTYYWRVDESNPPTPDIKGNVWSFTTVPDIPITDPNLVAWWTLDEGMGLKALDWSGHGRDGTLANGTQWVDGYHSNALYFDGVDDYVDMGTPPELYIPDTYTYTAWFKVGQDIDGNSGPQYLLCIGSRSDLVFGVEDGVGVDGDLSLHYYDTAPGFHAVGVGQTVWSSDEWHMVAATKDSTGHKIYLDGEFRNSDTNTNDDNYATSRMISLGARAWTGHQFYNGSIDDVRIYNKALTLDEIKQVMRGDPLLAWDPSPRSGSMAPINIADTLTWSAGDGASQHDVYFGSDRDAVAGADASDTTGIYKGRQNATSYVPEGVEMNTGPHYWRIDEVTNDGTINKGNVWSFSVTGYALIDNFESYNDIPEGEPGSNLVYLTWIDGFDNPNVNGSTMGYVTGTSMETGNVHGGNKSVPLQYNNATAGVSEVVRTFAPAQDWTAHGLITLSLWFAGDAANVPGQLYVKVNGVQVNYDGDTSNLARSPWQVWNIDLTAIGTNMSNVMSLAIGVQGTGATGTLLLDDIRLYDKPRELITPVQPDPAGLVAQFEFEGNANDSAGGHNGVPNGGPLYQTGKFGQAISLDGVDAYVVVGSVGISGADPRTIAGWAKASILGTPAWVDVFGFTGPSGTNGHFDIELVGDTSTTTLGWYGLHVYGWEQNIMPIDLEWHHLAASYDGTTAKWYGDGLLVGSADRTPLNTPDHVNIGKREDNTNFFPGMVDDVRIYNRVLSDAEMAGLAGITQPFDKPF